LLYLPLPTNICVNFCYLRSKRIILVPSGWCLCHGGSLNTSVFSYLTKVVMLFYVVMLEQKKKSQNIGFLYVTLITVESSIHSSACKILRNLEGNLWLSDNLISLCSQRTPWFVPGVQYHTESWNIYMFIAVQWLIIRHLLTYRFLAQNYSYKNILRFAHLRGNTCIYGMQNIGVSYRAYPLK
jgi:hypothetical protein